MASDLPSVTREAMKSMLQSAGVEVTESMQKDHTLYKLECVLNGVPSHVSQNCESMLFSKHSSLYSVWSLSMDSTNHMWRRRHQLWPTSAHQPCILHMH